MMAQGGPKQAPRDGEEGKKNDGFSRIDKRDEVQRTIGRY